MSQSLPEWDNVVARLDSLESQYRILLRQNRWMKQIGLGGVILAGVLVFLGLVRTGQAEDPKPKKVIEANEFLVKDGNGKTRVSLTAETVLLNNEDGDSRLALYTNKAGGTGILIFTANDHKQQVSIMHTKEGFMSFGINDKNGKTRAMLATRPDGKPVFSLQDENQMSFFAHAQP